MFNSASAFLIRFDHQSMRNGTCSIKLLLLRSMQRADALVDGSNTSIKSARFAARGAQCALLYHGHILTDMIFLIFCGPFALQHTLLLSKPAQERI